MSQSAEKDVPHNHVTRDIKPRGQCPGCDRYHNRHSAENGLPVPPEDWCHHHPEWADNLSRCHHPDCLIPPGSGGTDG